MRHLMMRRAAWLLVGLCVLVPWRTSGSAAADPQAIEIADQVMTALGGRDAWDGTRYVRFTFLRGDTVLKLSWDKWSGRFRLDAATPDGPPFVVLMNVNTKQGEAYLDGQQLTGEARDDYVSRGYRVWKGETYWFLMPFKLRDPGVTLRYEGHTERDGVARDTLHLSFEEIDESGNEFWVYVNPKTHLVDGWKYRLGQRAEGEFRWTHWERHGGLMLSTVREAMDGTVAIRMTDIVVANDLPDELFSSPAPIPAR